MFPGESHDRLRFRVSDEEEVLRIVAFDILNPTGCQGVVEALRRYLLRHPLDEVDSHYLRAVSGGGSEECTVAPTREVEEQHRLFVRRENDGGSHTKRNEA